MIDFGALWRFQLMKSQPGIDRALRSLVRDAYEHVPHVRQRFLRAGVQPNEIRTRGDLRLLPVISRGELGSLRAKEILRHDTDPRRCVVSWTSGTTGRQLAVHMSRAETFYRQLLLYNAIRRNTSGYPPLSITEAGSGSWKGPLTRRAMGAVRVTWVPRTAPLAEQAEQLANSKPTVITGHPSCLELIAEQIHLEARKVRPQLVVCRGEVLEPSARLLLSQVFDCRVVDYYSCDEVGNVAWECPNRSGVLHVNSDGCIVEIADANGQVLREDREGSVVLTNLFNRTMPFIRYSLGDRASVLSYEDHCNCGFRGVSLSSISGREMQFFPMADGTRVSARAIATVLNRVIRQFLAEYPVGRYQVIQDDLESIRVRLRSQQELPQDYLAEITQGVEQLSPELCCSVEVVDEIEAEPSGKFQRYITHVARNDSAQDSF